MTPSSLLVIHQGALGDMVLTFPAVVELRKKFERLDMLCQFQPGKLATYLGLAEKCYPLESSFFATLFSDQPDGKIEDLINSYATILVFSFASDLKTAIVRIRQRPCFQIPPRPPAGDKIHVTEFLIKNLLDCGLLESADSIDRIFSFRFQWKGAIDVRRPIDTSIILIHPGSGSIRKRWPLIKFLELADEFKTRGLKPQFICGPAEPDLARELRKRNRPLHHLTELTALVDLLESAGGYIGNDSGVSHLAAFLGLPGVVIFGPSEPFRWKPIGPRIQTLRIDLNCEPCFEIEPENCPESRCLTDASLKSVLNAFDRAYGTE